MFVDALWANLAVFAVGQLVAVGYLRTGRFWLGMAATVALWGGLDWWLVQRFLFAATEAEQRLPLLLVQVTAVVVVTAWTWARLRRRAGRATRTARYRAGLQALLAGEAAAAVATFRALCWSDPWDASAWLGLGDALRRNGEPSRARRAYRRAEGVDVRRELADLLAHRRAMLASPPRPSADPKGSITPGPAAAAVSPPGGPALRKQAR
ncbi:MAG: hypothetical protein H6835_02570 [Planctomycetes bacterium]|nr:hypothetical protein [Planctomycetota bacterium]